MNSYHGVTVIAILHDLNLAAQFSKQLIMLSQGRIFQAGTPEEVLTAENIKGVYNTDVLVIRHPLTGVPQIVILPATGEFSVSSSLPWVHLICGGGVGGALMGQLSRLGCHVSAGVINIQDTDWDVGHALGIELVEEKPFSSISSQSYEANLQMAKKADVVFLLETPFGCGNIFNAQVLEPLLADGKPCYIVDAEHLPERDYTGGEVVKYISMLKKHGLQLLPDQLSVLQIVQTLRKEKSDVETALG
jgi:iron complex transport system ATP-binding protein